MPAWRRFWTMGVVGLTAFAVYAIASDALLDQPYSATTANNVIAIAFFAGFLGWIFRPALTPSREVRTVRVGALAVSLTAVADNLRGMGALTFPGPDVEPFGFTVFIACLGTVAVWRVLAEAQRLVAIDRTEHRTTDPVFDSSANHAFGIRSDHRGTIPADDGRGRRLLRLPGDGRPTTRYPRG
jgi:hypothetical protein